MTNSSLNPLSRSNTRPDPCPTLFARIPAPGSPLPPSAGNLGNLPLVIVSSLANSASSLFSGIPAGRAEDLAVSDVVVGLLVPVIAHATIGTRGLTGIVRMRGRCTAGASAGRAKFVCTCALQDTTASPVGGPA